MDGVYYNQVENVIVFTQGCGDENYCEPEWSILAIDKSKENINNPIKCSEDIWLFLK